MSEVKVSLIIPTYNSERTIRKTLESIVNQTIGRECIEILVIDAGSTDETRSIALSYGARILENEKKLPEIAKHIGFLNALGKYAIYIDSDESFSNCDSLNRRVLFLEGHPEIKNLVSTGMICQENECGIVRYANYVADPFSQFVYRFNGYNRIEDLCRDYANKKEKDAYIFNVNEKQNIPLFDAAGNMFELRAAREYYNKSEQKANFVANIFENMVYETRCFAILENDFVVHVPLLTTRTYFKKLKWRIKNNVFPEQNEGIGFVSRQSTSSNLRKRKYLFIPYCFCLIPPLFDAVRFSIKNRDIYFLMHWVFTEYVFIEILLYMFLKVLHVKVTPNHTYAK